MNLIRFMSGILLMISMAQVSVFAQDTHPEMTLVDSVVVTEQKEGKIATHNLTATKLPVPNRLTPSSVSVVTQAVFNAQNSTVLGDALRNISGVNVQSGNGVYDYFTIRGFNSLDNGLVLTNGTAEPEVTFYNLYNIERVEVLKGPVAFLYGANPLSGTVNLVRKQPQFSQFARSSVSYGSFNSFRGTFDSNYGNADRGYAFRVNGMYQQSDFHRDDKENDSYAVNPSLTWLITDRITLHADYEYATSNYSPDAGLPLLFATGNPADPQIPDVPEEEAYETPFDFSEQKINRAKASLSYSISPQVLLRNKFYFTKLDWQSKGTLLNGAYPDGFGGTTVIRFVNSLDDVQKMIGNQLELQANFYTAGAKHRLLAGVEFSRLQDEFRLGFVPPVLQPGFPGISPVSLNDPADATTEDMFNFVIPNLDADASITNIAPYLIDQVTLFQQLQVFLGGRFDNISYDDNRTFYDVTTGQPAGTLVEKKDFNRLNPLVGLVYSPRESVSLYGSMGSAFAPPSTQIGASADAEESNQIEFGVKSELANGRLRANVAYFDLRKDDFAIPQGDGTAIVADQRSKGVELEIIAEPLQDLVLFANYAFTDAELTEFVKNGVFDYSGNRPAFAPEHLLNIFAIKDFANGFGVNAGLRFTGSQFIDEDNALELDGYTTIDAGVFYRLNNARLGVNLKNIAGTEYFTRGYDSYSIIPGNPFAAYGSIEIGL